MKGKEKRIPIYDKNPSVKIIGILDYITGMVYCEEHVRYDANIFVEFLRRY